MSSPELPAGTEVLGFRIETELGRGGMGVVYLAEDLRLQRHVALKLLAPSLWDDERFRARFLFESQLAASLDHPCVIPIFAAGEGSSGLLFIAMRYVAEGDLKSRLRTSPLSQERAVAVCSQVADALDFAHERGLLHGDVKPSNVLLDGRDHAYLADFGVTRRLSSAASVEPELLGTIDYVAPEQIRGEQVDGRADEYSLACLLYECLVGEPPFARPTNAAVLFAHLEEAPPAPAGLETVMRVALAKDPAERYATCADMIAAAATALGTDRRGWAHASGQGAGTAVTLCPFKGLTFFDAFDAEYFHGRDRVVSDVVGRLAAATLVGIVGPSGVGKSSVVRAGVLPALRAGGLPGSAGWRQVVIRPGAHPMAELTRGLGDELAVALARLVPGQRIVLAIDQLEEVFGVCQGEEERREFLEALAAGALDPERRMLVVPSLRADFYGALSSYQEFARSFSASHVLVGPMDRAELRQAIEEPATRAGLEVEPALVEALVDDVAGEPGGLPLLSTMLLELWRGRDGRTLRFASYQTSGGARGAIARLAERTFEAFDEHERQIVRSVMLRLAASGEEAPARRQVPLAELQEIDGAEPVIAGLVDARLVTVSDDMAEVSHEALLTEWPRCRAWFDDDRAGLRLHAHLRTSARGWSAGGMDPGELYRGVRLAGALEWAAERPEQIEPLELEFLEASRRDAEHEAVLQHAKNRKLRIMAIGTGLLSVLALLAVVVAEIQNHMAVQQRRTAQSLALASSAEAALGANPQLSALLALKALRISATDPASLALRTAVPQLRLVASLGGGAPVNSAGFNGAGTEIATAGLNGTARIWSVSGRRLLGAVSDGTDAESGLPDPMTSAEFSPDGRQLLTASLDGTARLWSSSSYRQLGVITEPNLDSGSGLEDATFSPSGREIATVSDDGTARIWDARTLRQLLVLRLAGRPGPGWGSVAYRPDWGSVAFSPDGNRIVVVGLPGVAELFDATTGARTGALGGSADPIDDASFSPDGREIVTASSDGTAQIWSAQSRRLLASFTEPGGGPIAGGVGIMGAEFSPTGRQIVTASQDGTARVWSVATGRQLFVLAGHARSVQSAQFSPDGRSIVTTSEDGTAKLWNAGALQQLGEFPAAAHSTPWTFSADGREIVSRSGDALSVRSAKTLKPIGSVRLLPPAEGQPEALAVSPTMREVMALTQGQDIHVWATTSHRLLAVITAPAGSYLSSPAFSPDGTEVVDALTGTVWGIGIWSARTGKLRATISLPPDLKIQDMGLASPSFSDNGTEIVAIGGAPYPHLVWVWNTIDDRLVARVAEPAGIEVEASCSPDGSEVAIVRSDGTVDVWSVRRDRRLGVLREADGSKINTAAFSPNGTEIVTASADGTAQIWNTRNLAYLSSFEDPIASPMTGASFSPDGKRVITTELDGTVRIWSAALAGPVGAVEQFAEHLLAPQLTPAERREYLPGA